MRTHGQISCFGFFSSFKFFILCRILKGGHKHVTAQTPHWPYQTLITTVQTGVHSNKWFLAFPIKLTLSKRQAFFFFFLIINHLLLQAAALLTFTGGHLQHFPCIVVFLCCESKNRGGGEEDWSEEVLGVGAWGKKWRKRIIFFSVLIEKENYKFNFFPMPPIPMISCSSFLSLSSLRRL